MINMPSKLFKNEDIVGHILREVLRYCCCSLNSGGRIGALYVTKGKARGGNGLEIP